jgi:hypothetical protein
VATVTHNMLQNTWTEVTYRLGICHASRATKVVLVRKELREFAYVMVQTGHLYNEHISRCKFYFLGTYHPDTLFARQSIIFVLVI